uniref:4-coumarate--CoA ligase n=1 Tax=Aureoumbra lagunensis TaxID=44058 RepID=A0A6S8CSW5_9STRA
MQQSPMKRNNIVSLVRKLVYHRERRLLYTSPYGKIDKVEKRLSRFVLERVNNYVENGNAKDKAAVVCAVSGKKLIYGEFKDRVMETATKLEPQSTLLLHMPNTPEFAIGFHAALEAGGRVSTSNPLYTARELMHQIKDSGASHVITISQLAPVVEEACKELKNVTFSQLDDKNCPITSLDTAPKKLEYVTYTPEDANACACIPYSSGTTGLPKGVMLSHTNLATNILQTEHVLKSKPEYMRPAQGATSSPDKLLGVLPFFHIYGMNTLLNYSLSQGATIISIPKFDHETFCQVLINNEITIAHLVPPLVLFLAHAIKTNPNLVFPHLRAICSGAAPLDGETQGRLSQALNTPIFQGYGMTETSPVTHFDLVGVPGSVGQLAPGTECRLAIVSDCGNTLTDVQQGEAGELLIRGPQVMLGYLHREQDTQKTLLKDGWLRTGDVAICHDQDTFRIVDRVKELIKVKGLQVSPAELEGLLLQHPDITDAAVVAQPCDRAGELPHAFVVGDFCKFTVSAYLNDQLAVYKHLHPDRITQVDAIPKSASGKILRRELKKHLLEQFNSI